MSTTTNGALGETLLFNHPTRTNRLRAALERLRRNQLRGSSAYDTVRMLVPAICLAAVWLMFVRWGAKTGFDPFLSRLETIRHVLMAVSVAGMWNLWLSLSGYAEESARKAVRAEIFRLCSACCACGGLLFVWGVTGRSIEHGTRLAAVATVCLLVFSLVNLACFVLAAVLAPRHLSKRGAIIVGTGPRAHMLKADLLSHYSPIELYGCVDDEFAGSEEDRASYLGPISNLADLLKTHPIEMVLIGLPVRSKYDDIQRVVRLCETIGVETHFMQDMFDVGRARFQTNAQTPHGFNVLSTLVLQPTQHIKRLMDILGGSILLLLFSPVMLAAAIAVGCTSKGPIFFVQERYGRHRKRFPMYKFRSMVVDAEVRQAALESQNEAQGPVFKLKSDPRVTRVGAFLRKTSIDELPQLFNVVRGEMSLVGPRPLPLRDVSRFEHHWLLRRFSVRPGLTCIWQVNGRSNTTFDSWIRQDLDYIDGWSLSLDVNILVRTIPAVLRGSGAV